MGKVRFLVINVLNDCCICMCLNVCIYMGMSGRIPFKGGENVKPGKSVLSFFENERIGNSYPEQYRQNPRSFSRPRMTKRITPLESSCEI